VLTRALVDAQTTQLESIMLQQRLAEMRVHAQVITKRLQALKKQSDAQRQLIGKVAKFRAQEQAKNTQSNRRKNLQNKVFREDVQNAFKMTEKGRGWRRVQREINQRHRSLNKALLGTK